MSNFGLFDIDDPADLIKVASKIVFDVGGGEHWSLRELIGGISDLGSEVANNEDDLVAKILKFF